MNNRPPLGTLIIENVDRLGPNAVVGIDTQFFTVQNFLKGIKLIPAGHHLLHYSDSVEDGVSMRYAWWFSVHDGEALTVTWTEEKALFTPHDPLGLDLGDVYQYMVSYPEDPGKWARLCQYIDSEALEEYLPSLSQAISTATPLAEENMVLLDVLKSKKLDISVSDQSNEELKYTIIQPQKMRLHAFGEQLTRDALDRSWYLAELFGHDIDLLLAEIQVSFIHFVVLCNLCSYTQWMSLLALALTSKKYLRCHAEFSLRLLDLLQAQLETLPENYVLESLGTHVVERGELQAVFRNLNDIYEGSTSWHQLVSIAQRRFGLSTTETSMLDENLFEVYDLLGHDEEDEDAPALVF
ncbi:hypothetical protein METBIDRAFT_78843 [Metschnikowia bicuspidata var. bicuspidata NRRL YB-4993]|uniref:A1 cistron-splicing factor n=1 Tax=Metschnikowia bicuspidata var. bicuspidata NRRL YB-4993 TaxID=869754 RepID=A0A1A0H8N1_9ASCO|nr:hypothetical protein METBIDRAFT_78843 [Metschnikowia bicuspidata var. bicuspidata NRRL YB-4993]OBA20474.1 hypothetical protein METBIDRAFT_78843 [Metschnikowia bicuspidata var. bicuspidata NRRL YB-4993]